MTRLRALAWLGFPFAGIGFVGLGFAGFGSIGFDPDEHVALGAVGTVVTHAVPEPAARHAAVDRLAWLAGCWEGTLSNGATYEEAWLAPRGATLVGVSRMTRDGRTLSFEFMRITPDPDGTPVYNAQPSGGPPTPFRAVEITEASVTFANPDHDFPQRIRYRFTPPNELNARIEGVRDGQTGGFDFPLRRVACPG